MVEEEVVDLVETKSIKFRLKRIEGKGRGCSQGGRIKILARSRSRLSCKKRGDANIHEQGPSREILERKHSVQKISREQERGGNYGQKNQKHDSQQNIDRDGQKSLRLYNQYRLVQKSNGDYWLVIDMQGVNQFMKPIHFKMEGTPTLEQLLMKNDFAISYDLKEAYNHIPVHPTMQDLLGIQYQGRLYKYQRMVLV
jgi:hypothetical protein